jgi:hypothetical protein
MISYRVGFGDQSGSLSAERLGKGKKKSGFYAQISGWQKSNGAELVPLQRGGQGARLVFTEKNARIFSTILNYYEE